MAKAIATYSGGIHYLAQAALREDGTMFVRLQNKTRYGYQWSKWAKEKKYPINYIPETVFVGFNDLSRTNMYTKFNCRLPNK